MREGRPSERIAEMARETNADLVVVGEHGHRRGLRDVLGNTAEQLVHTSPVPVLLARGQAEGAPQRVLVPIDESPDCYKSAEEVIRAVTGAGLAEVDVTLRRA